MPYDVDELVEGNDAKFSLEPYDPPGWGSVIWAFVIGLFVGIFI